MLPAPRTDVPGRPAGRPGVCGSSEQRLLPLAYALRSLERPFPARLVSLA